MDDIKDLIHREIQSISNLNERVAFKDMMEGVFLALYEKNEEMYQKLETRVMNDLAYNINRYRIKTGIIEKQYLDLSHHMMTPVCLDDLDLFSYTIGEIRKIIKEEGYACISTVFLQGDVLEIEAILKMERTYSGILKTNKEYSVPIGIKPSKRYLEQIEHLYHLFIKNGIPWQTVNAPYFFKMMDLILFDVPDEAKDQDVVTGISADFEEYNRIVHYDMVPIWNVHHLELKSMGFPIACGDHENYEHVVSIRDYGTEHTYLVEEKEGMCSVRQNGERLLITGKVADTSKWNIWMIRNGEDYKIDRYTYLIMENLRKDGFVERFQKRNGQKVRTKGELERFIRGFGMDSYIEYKDCKLEKENNDRSETYSMNFFIKDEIREQKGRKRLILYFKAKGNETWLLRDIASFVVSEVQELYPEYQCEGKLE